MGNLDFPKVIAAAAVSPLGVLSLLVLLMAMIALSFFRRSGDSVKLAVFGGMLLSVVGFGAATMMAGQSSASRVPPETPSETASAGLAVASPSAQPLANIQQSAAPSASMSGLWSSGDDFSFRFIQTGQSLAYDTIEKGAKTGSGQGRIEGNHVAWHYVVNASGESGDCSGTLSPNGRAVTGQCASGDSKPWDLAIRKLD